MAFKTFAPGVLTSSDMNTFLMRQAVITCTSSTRPSSPSEGMTIYETDTDIYRTYSGSAWVVALRSGAWNTFTPTIEVVGGSGTDWTIGNATASGRYAQLGNLVMVFAEITFGSTSVYGSGSLVIASLPVNIRTTTSISAFTGSGALRDASASTSYACGIVREGNNKVALYAHGVAGSYSTYDGVRATVPFTWTTSDSLAVHLIYERA